MVMVVVVVVVVVVVIVVVSLIAVGVNSKRWDLHSVNALNSDSTKFRFVPHSILCHSCSFFALFPFFVIV